MSTVPIEQPGLVFVEIWDSSNMTTSMQPIQGIEYVEVVENALRGPPGPSGAPGGPITGTYVWNDTDLTPPAPGEVHGPDPSEVAQGLAREGSVSGQLAIAQVDAQGLNCGFFEVVAGNHLLIRDVTYSGVHDLVVTGRTGMAGYALIDYVVESAADTPVVGSEVEVGLFGDSPSDLLVSSPGPTGATGPTGPTGAASTVAGPTGPTGAEGPPGGAMVTGWWSYGVATTPPPAVGQVRTAPSPTVVGQPLTIYLSATDRDGLVWQGGTLAPGDDLRLRGTAGAVQHCTVTSFAVTVPGSTGYATVETVVSSLTAQIAKNADVEVSLIHAPQVGPTGPTGPPGPTLGEVVVTFPTGSEPTLVGLPDGTLLVEYTP